MAINVTKPSVNLREKLNELETNKGLKGNEILQAETAQEVRSLIGAGRKNLIINGGFDVWQRGTSGFGHNVYSADRWREDFNTGNGVAISKHNISSGGETGLPLGFTSAFKYALTVGSGSGSGLNDVRQKIELPKRFEGQTFTLSYYVKASSSCTVSNRRIYATNVTNPFSGASLPSLSVTTTWQKVTDTFTFGTSSTAVYSSSSFLDLVLSAPVATSVDIDYYITGVQLELGSVATDFEHRSYGEELALCQRYFWATAFLNTGVYNTDTSVFCTLNAPVTFRTAPTVSMKSGTYTNINIEKEDAYDISNVAFGYGTTQAYYLANPVLILTTPIRTGFAGQAGMVSCDRNDDAFFFEAEL